MAKDNAIKLNLPSVDDLFSTQESRDEAKNEKIIIVPAEDVHPYVRQPYQTARLTPDLVRLMDSIGRHGIETPLIARPRAEGGYEIISGHRRDYCAGIHNIPDRPLIVRNYTDDEADILVADLNIVREENLPSELARAYKLRYDAMKRQGKRTDLTSGQFEQKFPTQNSRRELADTVGKTEDEVRRILRLNDLIPEILKMVDENKIAVRPASEISYLSKEEQQSLLGTMELEDCTPSLAQAIKMKQFSQDGRLNDDVILSILSEEKPNQKEQIKIAKERISKYFPEGTPAQKIEETIIKALELYRKRQRDMER
jgi:ParB family chromosome partitioning protein